MVHRLDGARDDERPDGPVRQVAAGLYAYLYLAQKSFLKIAKIVREEMDRIGGQEFYLPALNPAELWKETGRWDSVDVMFKFKDRNQHEMCLGMTHEEEMTNIARGELRSYKQLPQIWYQIQEKFRDEPRPKSGLLRLRQFMMKDSYSFDLDDAGLDASFEKHAEAYRRIFDRCGLKWLYVEAYSGMMGGKASSEFTAPTDTGEDWIALSECGYAANLEKAESKAPHVEDLPGDAAPEPFDTPGQKTIEDLVKFTGESPARMIKTLDYSVESEPVVILLRGDHTLSETKLVLALGTGTFRPATPEEALKLHGAHLDGAKRGGVADLGIGPGAYGIVSGCEGSGVMDRWAAKPATRSRPKMRGDSMSRGPFRRECCAGTKGSRSSLATRCTSSRRTPTWRTRSISPSRAFRSSGSTDQRTHRRPWASPVATS